jgi:hypothetical protein
MQNVHSFLMQSCYNSGNNTHKSQSSSKSDNVGIFESSDSQFKYRLGIIDFLTDYNTAKKLETKFNNMRYGKDK